MSTTSYLIKEHFTEANNLIDKANQAATEEDEAVSAYNIIHGKINTESQNGEQLTELREKWRK